jgi:hypothetical protein
MRSLSALALCAGVLALPVGAENWLFASPQISWPWDRNGSSTSNSSHRVPCIPYLHPCSTSTTTTSVPLAFPSFEHGVVEALGFDDVSSCMKDTNTSVRELWQAAQDYLHGNWVAKAEALKDIAKAVEHILQALGPCSDSMTDASDFKKLYHYLKDPRYYTAHNALTLGLNLAEDHSQLGSFKTACEEGDYHVAGFELTRVLLDVMGNPGIPSANGTAAIRIAWGLAKGFTTDIDLPCFKDVHVEIPALIGGVMDIMSVVDIVNGLESLFHGLEGIVPTYRHCMADKPKIVDLLKSFSDFKHPGDLANIFAKHIAENKLDLSLETASVVLDYKGAEWRRFGQDIGEILQKILIGTNKDASLPIVV